MCRNFLTSLLDVHFVDSEQAHEQVLAGDLELAFLTLPPKLDERLSYVTIWNDPLVFVVAPFSSTCTSEKPAINRFTRLPKFIACRANLYQPNHFGRI